ncbi:MAG: CPBP family intramembrane metalloprotease [Actinobacteria bacterium]|nr:CPBP family intramembrane metalloprotease [Actinomycetota bacterium]MCL6094980.1 CPBP family intramembrane metalloprotease [Actinomycetota bacterium]
MSPRNSPESRSSHPTPHIIGPTSASDAWTWLALAAVGFIAGQVFGALAVAVWAASTGRLGQLQHLVSEFPPPESVVVSSLVGLWVGLLGGVLLASKVRGTHSLVSDYGFRIRAWPDLPLGIAVGLAAQLVVIPVIYLPIEHAVPHFAKNFSRPAVRLTGGSHGAGAALIAICVVLLAPIVEELFFRGLVMRALVRLSAPLGRVVSGVVAVSVSALAFGLAHAEMLQLLGLVVVGIFLGLLAYKTGRLGPSIVTHATFNLMAVIVLVQSGTLR